LSEAEPSPGEPSKGSPVSTIAALLVGGLIVGAGLLLSRTEEFSIIIVSMDTTRLDRLSTYGAERPTSPSLTRLANEGVRFTQARSSSSWTLPAHVSLFSGQPAGVHGVNIDFQRMDPERPVLGRLFKDAGYRTVGLYTAPYVHPRFGFGAGMDFYEGMTANPMAYDLTPGQMQRERGLREGFSHQEITSPLAASRMSWFVNNRDSPKNLFFLHLFDPHYDYRAPARFTRSMVDARYAGSIQGDGIMEQVALGNIGPEMTAADLDQLKNLYDAEISFTDKHLGDVIAAVEREGLEGRVLVVVLADHGEEFFEDGRFGHRMSLRDEVIRVPLVFWGPGIIPEGLVIDDEVTLYDVLPTLLDYAGLEPQPDVWGRSLRPLIEGQSLPPRPSSSQLIYVRQGERDHFTRHDGLVLQGTKVVRRVQVPWSPENDRDMAAEPDWSTVEYDVYDLAADPGETHDLYDANPDAPRVLAVLAALEQELQAQQAAGSSAEALQFGAGDSMARIDLMEQLSALGYLTGQDQAGSSDETGR